MKTPKQIFICSSCGYKTVKWYGKCPSCGAWNTMEEGEPEQESEDTRKIKPLRAGDRERGRLLRGHGAPDLHKTGDRNGRA